MTELASGVAEVRWALSTAVGYTLLSRAFRCYLGRTLRFLAPESSTSEIQRALAGRSLAPGVARQAVELLRSCDLVKFARLQVAPKVLAGRANAALAVASEVERHLLPAPADGAPGATSAEAAA